MRTATPFRAIALGAATTVLATLLSGCGSTAGDTETATSSLRLGWTPGPAAPQIAIADTSGAWDQAGVDVQISKFTSGRESLEAMLGGGLDVAILAELPVVTASLRGKDVVIIDDLSRYAKYRLITRKDSGITDFAGLKGKRVAATTGTNMQYLAEQVLTSAGVTAEVVNVAPADIVAALSRGDVAGAFMFESFYAGAKKSLADNYVEIPVSPELYTGHMLVATTGQKIKDDSKAIQALVDGLVRATRDLAANPASAQQTVADYVGSNLPVTYLASVWADYRYEATLEQTLIDLMVRQGEWVRARGLIETSQTPDAAFFTTHVNASFLDRAPTS